MAASRTYSSRSNYRFLPTDLHSPIQSDSLYELDESDIWNAGRPKSPEFRRSAIRKKSAPKKSEMVASAGAGATAKSLPVNVPDWSMILKEEYNRRTADVEDDFEDEDEDDRVPPHEYLARQFARTRVASFSVHEGIGRTLKGRDLSRVRNAIWEKTGFED
ncbi:Senescence regulator [Heracleum sosnowskyi]|uniref:Senescence regulator n=1 Tax=Heracleum sosnowskyi TaxID=360622 RepID=A0AAD8N6E0_9APIA|nr:Senescence regulator [Heracleum sosnowskyi]